MPEDNAKSAPPATMSPFSRQILSVLLTVIGIVTLLSHALLVIMVPEYDGSILLNLGSSCVAAIAGMAVPQN